MNNKITWDKWEMQTSRGHVSWTQGLQSGWEDVAHETITNGWKQCVIGCLWWQGVRWGWKPLLIRQGFQVRPRGFCQILVYHKWLNILQLTAIPIYYSWLDLWVSFDSVGLSCPAEPPPPIGSGLLCMCLISRPRLSGCLGGSVG